MNLGDLIASQLGLVLRSQALTSGLTRREIQRRLSTERWRRVLPTVYATFTGTPTEDQRLAAAVLYGGAGSQITGAAALRWHGVRSAPKDPRIHLLVPVPRQRSARGFVIVIRTSRLDRHARRHRGDTEICSVARAAADAARCGYSHQTVRAFLAEVVQRRFTTVDRLETEAREGPKLGRTMLRAVVAELRDGVRSAPEAELRAIVLRSKTLPVVRWNPRLFLGDGTELPTPDGWIDEAAIALEADSEEFHASPDGWSDTLARHNQYAAAGILPLHFTPREIRNQPEKVLATIERAYLSRRGCRPQVTTLD